MDTVLALPVDEVAKLVPAVVSQAQEITVESSEDYEMACSFLTLIATRRKQVGETFDPIVQKAHATWQEAIAQRKKFLDPLNEAELNVKRKVSDWRIDEERKRRAEEDRLAAIAKKEQDDRAIAEAEALKANGDHELADMVLEEAANAPAPVVVAPTTIPKQDGISKKTNWKWRPKGNDEAAALRMLVKAAAADERLLGYLSLNTTVIGAEARTKKGLTRIPGIDVFPDESVSVRAK
jgi:hypothetical protein